jgi:hypothetical protein
LANLVIVLSVVVGAFALLDIFLNDKQKAKLSDFVTRVWNWLDDARRLRYLDWMRRKPVKRVAMIAAPLVAVSVIYLLMFLLLDDDDKDFLIWKVFEESWIFLCSTLAGGILTIWIILSARSTHMMMLIAVVILFLLAAPWIDYLLLDQFFLTLMSTPNQSFAFGEAGAFMIIGLMVFPFCLAILVPLTCIYLIVVCLAVGEFIVRRIAEYPKGPILAGSGAVGSIVAVIKALS